jgi:hypothetical protein
MAGAAKAQLRGGTGGIHEDESVDCGRAAPSPADLAGINRRRQKQSPRTEPAFSAARADSALISPHEELALIDSRLADLLTRVDTNEAGIPRRADSVAQSRTCCL